MENSVEVRNYVAWLNSREIPQDVKKEVRSMISHPDEIEAAFSEDMAFGAAGLQAKMGVGTTRMNVYTAAEAAYATAAFLMECGEADKGIVISYDSRNHSREFAEIIARVAGEAGVRVLLSDKLRPAPMLSYAVRYYGAAVGIMVTASSEPKEMNGIILFGNDGGLLKDDKLEKITSHMGSTRNVFPLVAHAAPLEDLVRFGDVELFGEELDDCYCDFVRSLLNTDDISAEIKAGVRIIYTPLNGSGRDIVLKLLRSLGFTRVLVVPEQEEPDGSFPTVDAPDPRREDAYRIAIKYASMSMADIVIATDPDSGRLGVAVPDDSGDYRVLKGNQIGALLMEYVLSTRLRRSELPDGSFCVTSIASTGLADKICERYGVSLYRTLPGLRHIADLIDARDDNGTGLGDEHFLFAFEEDNAYMFSTAIPYKDAAAAAIAIAAISALSRQYRTRLFDQLKSIYTLCGNTAERHFTVVRGGLNGRDEISGIMKELRSMEGKLGWIGASKSEIEDTAEDESGAKLRKEHQREIEEALSNLTVAGFTDYQPEEDALFYELEGGDWISVIAGTQAGAKASGKEAVLDVYLGCRGASEQEADQNADRLAAVLAEALDI